MAKNHKPPKTPEEAEMGLLGLCIHGQGKRAKGLRRLAGRTLDKPGYRWVNPANKGIYEIIKDQVEQLGWTDILLVENELNPSGSEEVAWTHLMYLTECIEFSFYYEAAYGMPEVTIPDELPEDLDPSTSK